MRLLGLCQKAGKLVSGEPGVEKAVRGNTARLIILAGDASNNTVKKFTNSSTFYQIPILTIGTKQQLGKAIGKEIRAVLAVTEEGFSKKILEYFHEGN